MKVFLNEKDIKEYLDEEIDELKFNNPDNEVTVIEGFKEVMENSMDEFFPSNEWSEYEYYSAIANYNGKSYEINISEDGCCEATNEHRIMYMKSSIKEIPFITEPKKLVFEEITYNEVQDDVLENLINDVYGHRICIAAETEGAYNVPNMVDVDEDECDNELITKFIKSGKMEYGTIRDIMNDLCKRGHMPSGTYGIYILH